MCGIAGYLNLSTKKTLVDETLLQRMQEALTHRGPDDGGIWKSDVHHVGFAHRRLNIIDLSPAGHQPMSSSNNRITVCFNGEIYNHAQLRVELEARGHTYHSHTDTETLIHAYEEWGINFLDKLEGMFAIALFDAKKNELYLVRDRIGIKPLYFSLQHEALSFASEIKALWQLPWIRKEISHLAYYHYLTFMVTPAPYTMYKNIYKLPAGFYAKVAENKEISFHEWYTPLTNITANEQKERSNETFCIETIRELLRTSTKKRMMSDVPFGAFLSGGIDSSLNVALMAREIGKVKTFTVAFSDGPESNELKWARRVAKEFGTDHHEIMISEKEAFDFYEKMIYHLDEPLADCVCIPFYHVAKLAKDAGVTVAQVGEGSDELFFGYNLYAQYHKLYTRFWHPTHNTVPIFLKKTAYHAARILPGFSNHHRDILRRWAHNMPLFLSGAVAFSEYEKKLFFRHEPIEFDPIIEKIYPGFPQTYDSGTIASYHLAQLHQHDPHADFITQMTYLELKQRLPELLLMRADKMSMATSLEARVPFLDHRLVEFALTIPSHIKFKNNVPKYILKRACEGIIPHEIIYRKKIGFAAPIVRWLNSGKYFPAYFKKKITTTAYVHAVQTWTQCLAKTAFDTNATRAQ